MLKAVIKFGDGSTSTDTSEKTLAAALRDPQSRMWVDMEQPSEHELALLDDVFGFHPLAIEDCVQYSQRPKIENYNHIGESLPHGYFYMVIHGPDLQTFRQRLRTKELDLFVSERYLLTIHEEPMDAIAVLISRAETDPRIVLDPGIDLLLHSILDRLIDAYQPILDYLQDELNDLEERALGQPSPGLLTEIAGRKRDLLALRRVAWPEREIIAQLTRGEVPFIRESARIYLRDVLDHLIRVVELVEVYRDLVMGARDIYLSSVSNRLNQIMKTLTTISVIALPLTVLTSFFGMNFRQISSLESPWVFWGAVVGMLSAVGVMYYYMRRNEWL